MILEFDWNRGLFVARSRGSNCGLEKAANRPKLAFAVSPKYLSNETKIYIFITRIPRVVYIIFFWFFKNFIFPTSGRYLRTSSLKMPRRRRQPESQKSWIGKTTTHHAFLYISFLSHTTTSEKCLISRFMEDVNKRQLNFLPLSELEYVS